MTIAEKKQLLKNDPSKLNEFKAFKNTVNGGNLLIQTLNRDTTIFAV